MSAVRDVVETIAKALADSPDRVVVDENDHQGTAVIEVTAAQPDVGKMIGRQGRTIQAIRTLATLAGERTGRKVNVDIRDAD